MIESSGPLVSTSWLADHLSDPTLRIIDVSWKFREENGRGLAFDDRQNYLAEHIPGAVFVGMATELSDPDHPVPDMMVGPQEFTRVMQRLGVNNDTQVVVYDASGLPLAAARLWWALSRYGHNNVTVLDGGYCNGSSRVARLLPRRRRRRRVISRRWSNLNGMPRRQKYEAQLKILKPRSLIACRMSCSAEFKATHGAAAPAISRKRSTSLQYRISIRRLNTHPLLIAPSA